MHQPVFSVAASEASPELGVDAAREVGVQDERQRGGAASRGSTGRESPQEPVWFREGQCNRVLQLAQETLDGIEPILVQGVPSRGGGGGGASGLPLRWAAANSRER